MTRPGAQLGQIVRFEYLWALDGFDGGSMADKRRPCAIVVTMAAKPGQPARVMLCGITHSPPRTGQEGIELDAEMKAIAGLDDEPSWVIVSEVNIVDWEDPRFHRTPTGHWTYGSCSRELMEAIRQRLRARTQSGDMDYVNRPEIDRRSGTSE